MERKKYKVMNLFMIDPSAPRQLCAWDSDSEGGSDGEQLDASLAVFSTGLECKRMLHQAR